MSENVPVVQQDHLMGFIERASKDPEFDVNKFRELLVMYREERDRAKKEAFNAAMAEVQAEIGKIERSGRNPTFNNPYAKLEDLDAAARPIYAPRGFNIRYGSAAATRPGWQRITLTISHRDGYSEEHYLDGPPDIQENTSARSRTPIQAIGSTVTYLRRYLLQMVLNLVPANDPADDDGEASRRRPPYQPRWKDQKPQQNTQDPPDNRFPPV